jgi:hydroxymethylpyrimidine kinase/phosphomethylpyrimidine kinase/thiamine-phosphate diphosphorylase
MKRAPVCWTIAGSDSGGGAGIQADLLVMHAFGVHGCSVVTAVTAQNTAGVLAVEPVGAPLVARQLEALAGDLPPAAVKTGMLGSAETVHSLCRTLERLEAPVVCDPVLAASDRTALADAETIDALKHDLLPRVDVLTPNRPEAERLLEWSIAFPGDVPAAAAELLAMGPSAVLIKGGHGEGPLSVDYWLDRRRQVWLVSPRQSVTHTHGTGCVLSSALAAGRALGLAPLDAAVLAKAYLNQGLRTGGAVGTMTGPLGFGPYPSAPADLPWAVLSFEAAGLPPAFPALDAPIGLYPIVERADRVERLFGLGIFNVQLRIKDLAGAELERELAAAVSCARRFPGSRLFINDQWERALKLGAYGVHLGQDDLPGADLPALRRAGLRLGISTHGYAEMARAKACRPSYIALGTVYPTTSKVMDYPPLGVETFRRMVRLADAPVAAIGGISLENAGPLLEAGASGLAVISDLRDAPDLPGRLADWRRLLS